MSIVRRRTLATLAGGTALLGASSALAQTPGPSDDTQLLLITAPGEDAAAELDAVVVKGQSLRRQDNAFSTTALTAADIRERRVSDIDELFRDVPGMNVRDYGLGGVANQIVIRGFGNGAHGGDLGMVLDGIPLNEANSHADGYVDVNVMIPLEIAALTVHRGPVSALYGNFNRGGLIAYETRKGGDYAEGDFSAGGFETIDVQGALGATIGQTGQFNGALQVFHTDGFRPQSTTERITAAARYAVELSDRLDLSVAARMHAGEADSAAYLTIDQFRRDPYGIDPRTMNDGSKREFGTLRADLGYTLTPAARLLTFAYATRQEFARFFTRGPAAPAAVWNQREETYQRQVAGAGVNLNGRTALFARALNYVVGVEGFSETTEFQFYDGLRFRRRVNPAQFNRESDIQSLSAFGEADLDLHPLLEVSLGARYDGFTGECRIRGAETTRDACDDLERVGSFAPKIGVRSQILPALQLRASYSEGFALPSAFTKYAPGAQDLDPNELTQVELGAHLTPFAGLEFDAVAYRIDSTNEFASTAPGEFVNFGQTKRTGVEATARWLPVETIDLRAVYGFTDSEVEENPNRALLGRMVTGVPDRSLTLTAQWRPVSPVRLTATYRYVGEYATDALNTVYAPSYDVLDFGASYAVEGFTAPVRLYLDVENVTDEVYAASFNSLGSIATGAPRNLRVGVQVGF